MIGIIKNIVNLIGNKMFRNNNDFFYVLWFFLKNGNNYNLVVYFVFILI